MTRMTAMKRLADPELDKHNMNKEIDYICDKLDLTRKELMDLMQDTKKTFAAYKNKRSLIMLGARLYRFLGLEKRYFRK